MNIFIILNLLSFSIFAAGQYAHPRWCELTAKKEVGPYVNAAAGFVGIDPALLAIGMSSEGFAIKEDCNTRKNALQKSPQSEELKNEMKRACDPDRFKALNIYTISEGKTKASLDQWSEGEKYAPTNPSFVLVDPSTGFTDFLTSRKAMEQSFYGDSWSDDGSDTFGFEYAQLREKKYLPEKFISSDYQNVNAKNMAQMPDFVFLNDEEDRNEAAKNRFKTNQGPYLGRYGRQNPTQGDKGRTLYKTPEAQTFANAALWKHSQDKFSAARKELIAFYKSKGPSSPDYVKAKFLDREFSPTETAFWTKVFYNGGQGTQAGAWDVLKQFASKGWLANNDYLNSDPGVSLKEIYKNAREVADSYGEIIKTTDCTALLANKAGNIKTEDYFSEGMNSAPINMNTPSKVKAQ